MGQGELEMSPSLASKSRTHSAKCTAGREAGRRTGSGAKGVAAAAAASLSKIERSRRKEGMMG